MSSQSITEIRGPGFGEAAQAHHHGSRRGVAPFLGHFAEMWFVMMVGMMMIGMPLYVLLSASLGPSTVGRPEFRALGMAFAMTVPMVLWMLYRGHSYRASVEMGAAMLVPTLALLPLVWMGVISSASLVGLEHGLMLPSMLVVMLYRRHEYGL